MIETNRLSQIFSMDYTTEVSPLMSSNKLEYSKKLDVSDGLAIQYSTIPPQKSIPEAVEKTAGSPCLSGNSIMKQMRVENSIALNILHQSFIGLSLLLLATIALLGTALLTLPFPLNVFATVAGFGPLLVGILELRERH